MMEAAPDFLSGGAISSSSASSSPMANNSQNGGGEEVIDSVAAPSSTSSYRGWMGGGGLKSATIEPFDGRRLSSFAGSISAKWNGGSGSSSANNVSGSATASSTAASSIIDGRDDEDRGVSAASTSTTTTTTPAFPSFSGLASNLIASSTSAAQAINANVSSLVTPNNNISSSNSSWSFKDLSISPLTITTKLSRSVGLGNTLPDKTTASQVLMFRQLLHTRCRLGLRLSRNYEGTAAQLAVLHMPWWERGIEQTKKMVISYDNLITRLWLSGAILPYARGGFASKDDKDNDDDKDDNGVVSSSHIDTMIDEHGLPPVPHQYWVDRLGFQQDDPVTDFRSGGVLSLAMLVHIIESCPLVHSRFVPKSSSSSSSSLIHNDNDDDNNNSSSNNIMSLEEIIHDDASVLPFGITCINITDMLAKFLLFSKAVDKMDALLSAKPFWKMFIDPNALLILQEVSLDLLCDVCVEIGRERRVQKLVELDKNNNMGEQQQQQQHRGMPGVRDGKVTVFDFSEIMERTEKRVGEEILGAGPQNVDELRAVAFRVKSKYLMRIKLKEKHGIPKSALSLSKQHLKTMPMPSIQTMPMPTKESMMNVTNSVIGGVGGFVSMLKDPLLTKQRGVDGGVDLSSKGTSATATVPATTEVVDFAFATMDGEETTSISSENVSPGTVEVQLDGTTDVNGSLGDELDKLSSELEDLSTFDLLDGDDDFDMSTLEAMDDKVDPFAAFAIDKDDLLL